MNDENKLREKARGAIRAGKLPNRRPDSMWGGPSAGAACAVCTEAVKQHEVELEVEFARGGRRSGRDRYRVHVRCFAAWELELDQSRSETPAAMAGRPSEPSSGAAVSRRDLPETANVRKIAGNGYDATYKRGPA